MPSCRKARRRRRARRERRRRGAPLPAPRRARRRPTTASRARRSGAEARALEAQGATLVAGGHAGARLDEADLVVVSPGVPAAAPRSRRPRRRASAIWGEVELAVRSLAHPAPIVAIGGTNGKSTTTSLVGALLEAHGLRAFVGRQPRRAARRPRRRALRRRRARGVELPDGARRRVPAARRVAAQRHRRPPRSLRRASTTTRTRRATPSLRQTAERLGRRPGRRRHLPARRRGAGSGRVVTFGPGGDARRDRRRGRRPARRATRYRPRRDGAHRRPQRAQRRRRHRRASRPFGVAADDRPPRARDASAGSRTGRRSSPRSRGVRFYDDSKGTNVGAVGHRARRPRASRAPCSSPAGATRAAATRRSSTRSRARVAPPSSSARPPTRIARAIGDRVPVRRAATMDEAVRAGASLAQPGDAVLLSPACSSFDMFRDYKHRGDEFVRAVRALREGGGAAMRRPPQNVRRTVGRQLAAPARRQAQRRAARRARSTPCSPPSSSRSSASAS